MLGWREEGLCVIIVLCSVGVERGRIVCVIIVLCSVGVERGRIVCYNSTM